MTCRDPRFACAESRSLSCACMHYGRKILAYATAGALILLCPVAPSAARYAQRAPASPSTFGPLVGADSLDNFQIGGPRRGILAYRFRAPWTGTVNSVRFFAILNTEER